MPRVRQRWLDSSGGTLGLDHRVGHFRPLRIMGVTPNLHVLNGLEASTWDRSSWGGRRRDQGPKINVKKIHLDADDLVAKVPLVDGPGRGYSISEATGNEGATKDLWYHRGAVIMWPKERELDLVAKMDVDYGIHVLKRSMQDQNKLEGEYCQQLIRLA